MTAAEAARNLAVVAARAAAGRKAKDIVALDVSDRLVLTDVFLVASGRTERQVSAIVDAVEEALFHEGVKVRRREGESLARWVLLDFGDLIVHVQHAEDRMYYALERLWKDCPIVQLPPDLTSEDEEEAGDPGLAAARGSGHGRRA